MIDRALGFTAPESFYFQLYPVNLILLQEPVPSSDSKFKFSIYKGVQKFDENKIMTQANFIQTDGAYVMPLKGSQLNFYLPNFNKNRKILFTLKLTEKDANQEYDLGGIDIDPAVFINQFQTNGQNRFEQRIDISEQYALEFEVYLQKSRFALQKIVKSFQGERSMKSPVRQRVSPTLQRQSIVKEQRSPVPQQLQSNEQVQAQPLIKNYITNTRPKIEEPLSRQTFRQQVQTPKHKEKQQEKQTIEIRPTSLKKDLQETPYDRQKSEKKSQIIQSPAVKSNPVKRTSGGNQTTIKASQIPSRGETDSLKPLKSVDSDSWTNHIKLVAFTVVGILLIYWVMHPTSRV